MAKMIYPQNWSEPETPMSVELTSTQREQGKTMIKNFINGLGDGVSVNEVLHTAQAWIRNNTSKHVPNFVILEIIDEIYEEWKGTWTFLDVEE